MATKASNQTVGANVAAAIKQSGLPLAEVARRTGIHPTSLARNIAALGTATFPSTHLILLADVLEVESIWFWHVPVAA